MNEEQKNNEEQVTLKQNILGIEALAQCEKWFLEYAEIHSKKGNEDKYQRNNERALFCHDIINKILLQNKVRNNMMVNEIVLPSGRSVYFHVDELTYLLEELQKIKAKCISDYSDNQK